MSKFLDILMAGVISGIVAYTTSQLGITGTVIGAVLGSMLYQLMSHFFRQPLDNVKTQKVESSVFYVFPLIVILAIEVIYLLSSFYLTPEMIFQSLESATGWNLFRTIGVALLVMGIYPLLDPNRISKKYGYLVLAVGAVKLLGGFSDYDSSIVDLYSSLFYQLNELISIMVIAVLSYVIISIIRESVTIIHEKEPHEDQNAKIIEIEEIDTNRDETIKIKDVEGISREKESVSKEFRSFSRGKGAVNEEKDSISEEKESITRKKQDHKKQG